MRWQVAEFEGGCVGSLCSKTAGPLAGPGGRSSQPPGPGSAALCITGWRPIGFSTKWTFVGPLDRIKLEGLFAGKGGSR